MVTRNERDQRLLHHKAEKSFLCWLNDSQVYRPLKKIIFKILNAFTNRNATPAQQLLILNYHHIVPDAQIDDSLLYGYAHGTEVFEAQMKWLKQNFELTDDFKAKNGVIITFDDCSISTFEQATPILKKLRIPAYFFVVENVIGNAIWVDKYFQWVSYVPNGIYNINGIQYVISNRAHRFQMHAAIWPKILVDYSESNVLDWMEEAYPFKLLPTQTDKLHKRILTMDKSSIEILKENGFKVGFHSKNHLKLSAIEDERLYVEVSSNQPELYNTQAFAIPFGSETDYNSNVLNTLESKGFQPILLNHSKNIGNTALGRLNLPNNHNKAEWNYRIKKHLSALQ